MTARAITHRAAVDLRDIDRVPALIGRLAPADILLFWRIGRPNVVVWYQKTCGYPELGVRMGHVALYLGDGDLVHASPGLVDDGVRVEAAGDVVARRTVTVVRYPLLAAAGKADRDRIIETARAASGSYDYRAVASLAWDSLARLRRKGFVAPGAATSADSGGLAPRDAQAFLCGDFVFDVFDRTFRDRNPLNVPPLMLSPARVPAEFFVNPTLVDVTIPAPPLARTA